MLSSSSAAAATATAAATAATADATSHVTTTIAQEVARAWGSRVGSIRQPAPPHAVQSIFNDIHLYPTKTQVFEMLVCARQCSRRRSLVLSFGEFCVLAQELRKRITKKHSLQKRDHSSSKVNCGVSKWDVPATPRTPNGSSAVQQLHNTTAAQYELFLGGSCNPTTWRSEIAVPFLEAAGITYFNPQVADWSLELVEVEWRAKQAAKALLFVLDSETRAVAASVEASYLSATGRDLLLVLMPYQAGQSIGGEKVADKEIGELTKARCALKEVVERRGLPVFGDIESALRCARVILRGASTPTTSARRRFAGGAVLRLRRAYDAAFKTSPPKSPLATRESAARVLSLLTGCSKMAAEHALKNQEFVDFESFCSAAAEINDMECGDHKPSGGNNSENATPECDMGGKCELQRSGSAGARRTGYRLHAKAAEKKLRLMIPKTENLSKADSPVLSPASELRLLALPASLSEDQPLYSRDVFLADTRHDGGISHLLAASNLTIRTASSTQSQQNSPTIPPSPLRNNAPSPTFNCLDRFDATSAGGIDGAVEEAITRSRVLVFPITADSPHLTTMILAAHYMALRPRHTVLLIQTFADPDLSETAVKDYNRGRHYLADLATRDNVTVVTDVACVLLAVNDKLNTSSSTT